MFRLLVVSKRYAAIASNTATAFTEGKALNKDGEINGYSSGGSKAAANCLADGAIGVFDDAEQLIVTGETAQLKNKKKFKFVIGGGSDKPTYDSGWIPRVARNIEMNVQTYVAPVKQVTNITTPTFTSYAAVTALVDEAIVAITLVEPDNVLLPFGLRERVYNIPVTQTMIDTAIAATGSEQAKFNELMVAAIVAKINDEPDSIRIANAAVVSTVSFSLTACEYQQSFQVSLGGVLAGNSPTYTTAMLRGENTPDIITTMEKKSWAEEGYNDEDSNSKFSNWNKTSKVSSTGTYTTLTITFDNERRNIGSMLDGADEKVTVVIAFDTTTDAALATYGAIAILDPLLPKLFQTDVAHPFDGLA